MNMLSDSDQLRLIIREMLLSEKIAGKKPGDTLDFASATGRNAGTDDDDGPGGDPVGVVKVQSASGEAAANAEAQFAIWGKKKEPKGKDLKGKNLESHPMYKVLMDYWMGVGLSAEKAKKYIEDRQPWSAAFISKAHENDPAFKKSASHATYMRAAKKARDDGAKTGYVAYKPEELEDGPARNDVVCKPRGSGDGWDNIGAKNHCDIYDGNGMMYGGNLGDTSKKVKYKPKKAKMIIKKLAEAIGDEQDEAKIRDAIESVLLEKIATKGTFNPGTATDLSISNIGLSGGEDVQIATNPEQVFDHSAIDPSDLSAIKELIPSTPLENMQTPMLKFIGALPAAFAAIGAAKDAADAKNKTRKMIGSVYRGAKAQADAMYNYPYKHDLVYRGEGCKPGDYFFASKTGKCAAAPTSGVYGDSKKWQEVFDTFNTASGGTLGGHSSGASTAISSATAILNQHGYGKGKGGHGTGAAFDLPGGQSGKYDLVLDKAEEISGVRVGRFKEVDHYHVELSGTKQVAEVSNTSRLQEIMDEEVLMSEKLAHVDLPEGGLNQVAGLGFSSAGGEPHDQADGPDKYGAMGTGASCKWTKGSPGTIDPDWKEKTLIDIISGGGKSKKFDDVIPLDGGSVGIAHWAADGLKGFMQSTGAPKHPDWKDCRQDIPTGKNASASQPGCYYKAGSKSEHAWVAKMKKWLASNHDKQIEYWGETKGDKSAEAAKAKGWNSSRHMATAAGIANSLGTGGFKKLAKSNDWDPEKTLAAYAAMSDHKQRRKDRIDKVYPCNEAIDMSRGAIKKRLLEEQKRKK